MDKLGVCDTCNKSGPIGFCLYSCNKCAIECDGTIRKYRSTTFPPNCECEPTELFAADTDESSEEYTVHTLPFIIQSYQKLSKSLSIEMPSKMAHRIAIKELSSSF